MILRKLIQRVPDNLLVNRRPRVIPQQLDHASHGRLPVAVIPYQRGGLIQTMSLVPVAIVDQQFPG